MNEWLTAKIFFPGPTWIAPEVRASLGQAPPFHHRSDEYRALQAEVVAGLQRALFTTGPVYVVTSSATGIMEGAIRCVVKDRVLNIANGAFGERWHTISLACGKRADRLTVPWGTGVRPEQVRQALDKADYDAVTMIHNETSVGVMNPLEEIAAVVRERPDTLFLVDTVSSMLGTRIDVDALGLDVCLASVQKCFALPPGLSVVAVSERAHSRAGEVPDRGLYFDFLAWQKAAAKNQTPSTPAIPLIWALRFQLERIFAEGLEARFERHAAMANRVEAWALTSGFELFSEKGYRSKTVSCLDNTRGIDIARFLAELRRRGFIVANGYGDLKGKTWRVGHMGDLNLADVEALLEAADQVLESMP